MNASRSQGRWMDRGDKEWNMVHSENFMGRFPDTLVTLSIEQSPSINYTRN
jgi:hypothetical protein